MGVNSLPKTVTRQRRDCNLNPGPSAPESSTLTTRLPSHPNKGTPHEPLSQTLDLENFATGSRSCRSSASDSFSRFLALYKFVFMSVCICQQNSSTVELVDHTYGGRRVVDGRTLQRALI